MMSVKTITVTKDAYEALKSMKESKESFSKAILRIAKRKPLASFYGIIGKESGEKLEKTIIEMRKLRNKSHKNRLENVLTELKK